jgi:hypothetical protein
VIIGKHPIPRGQRILSGLVPREAHRAAIQQSMKASSFIGLVQRQLLPQHLAQSDSVRTCWIEGAQFLAFARII